MSLLEVRGLSRHYGALKAVDDVSFSLEAGSILGFIGPNGAGKSTTMRLIATLDQPTLGEVRLDGLDVLARPEEARPKVGFMPDRHGTYDDMTVLEFLDFFARAHRLAGAVRRQRLQAVIDFTGLSPLADKLTSQLSKGMRQRAALARTLLHDPPLLLLDEPADGLDPRARVELRELLRALAARGKGILISSHILTELKEICDSCVILEQGRLLAQGSVAEVLRGAAQVQGGLQVDIQVTRAAAAAGALEALRRLALEQPGVAEVALTSQGALVTLRPPGDEAPDAWAEETAAALLRALVAAQVPLTAFTPHAPDLEDAFLSVTRGQVQ